MIARSSRERCLAVRRRYSVELIVTTWNCLRHPMLVVSFSCGIQLQRRVSSRLESPVRTRPHRMSTARGMRRAAAAAAIGIGRSGIRSSCANLGEERRTVEARDNNCQHVRYTLS